MSVTSLVRRSSAPPPSAARARLAEAIAALREAEEAFEEISRATEWGGLFAENERRAREALESVRGGVEQATAEAVVKAVNQSPGGIEGIAAARAAITAAEDALAVATAARELARAKVGPAEQAVVSARHRHASAVLAVAQEHISPQIEALLAEIEALHRRVVDRGNLLQVLTGGPANAYGVVPSSGPKAPVGILGATVRFQSRPEQWDLKEDTSASRWAAALEALKHDAGAVLPDLVAG